MTDREVLPDLLPAEAPGHVVAMHIKLPPFWLKGPALWFAQIDTTCGITVSKTKLNYEVSSLSSEFVTEVRDLLLQPPAEQPFEVLKRELQTMPTTITANIRRTGRSQA